MTDILSSIGNAIATLINFIVKFFEDLVYLIKITGQIFINLPNYLGWLPPAMTTTLLGIFGVVIIYKILGREG